MRGALRARPRLTRLGYHTGAMIAFAHNNPDPALSREQRSRLLRLATNLSVATALLLIVAKLGAWALSGAVSLLASLIDSVMDALASVVNLLAVRYAMVPADAEHRFGHGKAEALAALGQATFIAGSAAILVLHAVDRLLHPQPVEHIGTGVAVIVFAMVATLGLLAVQRHVIRRTGSTAIRADALHYMSDLLVNASVLIALALSAAGFLRGDAILGIGIAIYVGYGAWRVGHDAVHTLMDHELPASVHARIREIVALQPGVEGVHDLRTRQSGQDYFIQMHLEFAARMPLVEAHAIGDAVEEAIRAEYPQAEVLIHHDPVVTVSAPR